MVKKYRFFLFVGIIHLPLKKTLPKNVLRRSLAALRFIWLHSNLISIFQSFLISTRRFENLIERDTNFFRCLCFRQFNWLKPLIICGFARMRYWIKSNALALLPRWTHFACCRAAPPRLFYSKALKMVRSFYDNLIAAKYNALIKIIHTNSHGSAQQHRDNCSQMRSYCKMSQIVRETKWTRPRRVLVLFGWTQFI